MSSIRTDVLALIQKEQRFVTKREICLLLNIKGARRVELKKVLNDLKCEGLYGKNTDYATTIPVRSPRKTEGRAPVKPETQKPDIQRPEGRKQRPQKSALGIYHQNHDGGWIESSHRRTSFPPIRCPRSIAEAASDRKGKPIQNNDVVCFSYSINGQLTIEEIIGNLNEPKVFSLMAIHNHEVPFEFSTEAIAQAKKATLPTLGKRTDYRDLPLITIDGEDARDFDDAVWAEPDTNPKNPDGWRAIVAIADVAYYVRPGDALDVEAFDRGNSIYFADRVVPMLPEGLSNEMCSLKPHEDRACVAVELTITSKGVLKSFHFKRGLMRSAARLTYAQVQDAIDGNIDAVPPGIWDNVLISLYGAYKSLRHAREIRGSLNLESTERKVIFDDNGKIKAIVPRVQQTSNQLIEELMIAANVAAARTLSDKKWPCLYRVHDGPDETRVENLKRVIGTMRLKIPKLKKMTPEGFNTILGQDTPFKRLVHDLVLRSQAQACYSPENLGHFGLGLTHYAHFTSPIRRYADLQVHRALIAAENLGDGGQDILPIGALKLVGEHISATERTAAQMEREVMDRYLVLHLEDYVGHTFSATIVGVTEMGIFFALDGSGAQGFMHKARLPGDYYNYDQENHRYIGRRTNRSYQLGGTLVVTLDSADARTSATVFSLPDATPSKKQTEKHPIGKRAPYKGTSKQPKQGNAEDQQKQKRRKPDTSKSDINKTDMNKVLPATAATKKDFAKKKTADTPFYRKSKGKAKKD